MDVDNCLILNLEIRKDLWKKLKNFRKMWENKNKTCEKINGIDYKDKKNTIEDFLMNKRLHAYGTGFRNNKDHFIGELGCYMGHYKCWEHIVKNNIQCCLILEDGIDVLRTDFDNLIINSDTDILFVNKEMVKNSLNKLIGYGMQGYIVTLNGARKLMEKCYTLYLPIDLQIRNLCNKKELKSNVLIKPYFKRNNQRISSISNTVYNEINLNNKQNMEPIIFRIINKLKQNNIKLDI